MKKVNVLQLVTGLGMGGAENVVFDLAKYSSRDRFNIFVLSLSKRDELLEKFVSNGIDTTILNKSKSLVEFIGIINEVNHLIKINNIQIIHAHMTHSIIIASFVKLLNPSLQIVYTSHSVKIGSKLRELIIWSLKPFRNIDIIFSQDLRRFFYKKNCAIIPNGIKINLYKLNIPKNNIFTFVSVGRLQQMKNHQFLIEIANKLRKNYNFEIHIVGEGDLRLKLQKLIQKYELEDIVKLFGLRYDVPKILNQSHCLLMPSLWEGLPIVLLEAGACKLPIISTPVGSIPSLLNEHNAYLSSLDSFEKNMINVITDYDKAKNKADCLYDKIDKEYSIDKIVKAHEKVYKSLL